MYTTVMRKLLYRRRISDQLFLRHAGSLAHLTAQDRRRPQLRRRLRRCVHVHYHTAGSGKLADAIFRPRLRMLEMIVVVVVA